MAMGQNHVPPVNIPIPTKIGSKMGGEFTYPKMGSHWFFNHSHIIYFCRGPLVPCFGIKCHRAKDPRTRRKGRVQFRLSSIYEREIKGEWNHKFRAGEGEPYAYLGSLPLPSLPAPIINGTPAVKASLRFHSSVAGHRCPCRAN